MKRLVFKDKGTSLLVLSMAIAVYTFLCMTKYTFSSAMVYIVDEGYMTKFQTGVIVSAFWAAYAITQVFGGIAADRWNFKGLVTIGLIGAALSNLAVYFCYENYIITVIVWSFNAAAQFAVWPVCFKIVSSMIAPGHRSKGMVIITLAYPVGMMLSYLVAASIDRWQTSFIVSTVVLLLMALAWEISMGTAMKWADEGSVKMVVAERSAEKEDDARELSKSSLIYLCVSSGLMLILVIAFVRSLVNQVQSLVPTMINESYSGIAPTFATTLSLMIFLCSAVGPTIGSRFSKLIKNEVLVCVVFLGAMIPAALVTLMLGKISYWFILAAVAVIVFLSGATSFYVGTVIATKFNKWGKGATVAGILNCFAASGNVVANFVLTLIADKLGWNMTLLVILLLICVAFVLGIIAVPMWNKFKKNNNV